MRTFIHSIFSMKGYIENLEELTVRNTKFRQVLYTGKHAQLVLMSLLPGEDIGVETHALDQFFRFESGQGEAILDGVTHTVTDGFCVVVPAGTEHNIVNTDKDKALRFYTVYSPPEHKDGVVFATKKEAEASEEHFDGETTE